MDERLLRALAAHRTGFLDALARGLMHLGTSTPVLAGGVVVAGALVVLLRAYRAAAAVALSVVVATGAAAALKLLIDRPRPPASLALVHLSGASMPSTHAARTAAAAVALLVVVRWTTPGLRRAAGIVLAALTVLVGAALVYLGVHWATDVLAGWALGALIGGTAGVLLRPGALPSYPVLEP